MIMPGFLFGNVRLFNQVNSVLLSAIFLGLKTAFGISLPSLRFTEQRAVGIYIGQ